MVFKFGRRTIVVLCLPRHRPGKSNIIIICKSMSIIIWSLVLLMGLVVGLVEVVLCVLFYSVSCECNLLHFSCYIGSNFFSVLKERGKSKKRFIWVVGTGQWPTVVLYMYSTWYTVGLFVSSKDTG